MRQANKRIPESAEKTVRDIRRATRRHHSAEEKIRIVLEGLRGEDVCRQSISDSWLWQFKRMSGSSGLKVQAAIAC